MQPFGKLVLALPGGQEQEFALAKVNVTLGRATTNDIILRDAKVSLNHAHLECDDEGCTLVDLGSKNGTCVNGVRVERTPLASGDVIALGDSTLRFDIAAPQIEPEMTLIHSEADLETTLTQAILSMTLSDTHRPRLAVHTPSRTWEMTLAQDTLTIGRHPKSDLVLDYPKVSRHHARIERRGEAFVIRDLDSKNGTWLGKQRVDEHTLQDSDTICIGDAQLVFKRGFEPQDLALGWSLRPGEKLARRPVVIVPGIMGSELWRGSEQLWPNVRYLFTRPEVFRLPEDEPVEARGLVGEVVIVPNLLELQQYNRLGDYLEEDLDYEREKDLLEFAYDWRQDLRLSARRLAEAIDRWAVAAPITIIAHSMGCLVSRYYVECLGGKKKVERLILIGGPHYGGAKAIEGLLLGQGLLPFGLLGERLRDVFATLPSAYQVLPTYACVFDQLGQPIDLLSDETWLPETQRPLLRLARDFRRKLGTRSSVPAVSVFGYGLKTATRATVQRDEQGCWKKVDFTIEPSGDTTVPEVSAVLEGSEVHPVQQYHGSLYVDNDVKMRLKLELTR